jgi:glycosyltransferase involved in cell wall biosynthesis
MRVSCIIPVHNGSRFLAESIQSVLGQTLLPLEVLVIDDGSTDGSAQVAAAFGEPVRVIRRARAGVSAARNEGVRLAGGELLAFLDADDLFLPRKLELQVARFRARGELELSSCLTENFWSPELAPHERDHDPQLTRPWPRSLISSVVRPSLFARVGGFDERMWVSQDVDWNVRAEGCDAVTESLPEVLCRRRLHADNVTRHARADCRAAVVGSLRRHLQRQRAAGTDTGSGA